MSRSEISEEVLERVKYALGEVDRLPPFQRHAELPVVIEELREWLEDERQWLSGYTRQWVSLLDDIQTAKAATGENLVRFLSKPDLPWREIAHCRAALNKQRRDRAADPAIRRRLDRASEALAARLADPLALGAVWDDLFSARSYAEARVEAQRLALLIGTQGLDASGLTKRLRSILEDEKIAVANAREESFERGSIGQRAGLPAPDRVSLARLQLFKPPRRADAVIWLKYALAPFAPDMLQVGETVTMYQARWLRSKLVSGDRDGLPAELRERGHDDHLHLKVLAGVDLSSDDEVEDETDDEPIPHVLVRVCVGQQPTAETLGLARETAELVVSLATLHGADPSIWAITESHVSYYDGREAGAAFRREPIREPTIEQRQAMRANQMADVASEWADELAPHLPLERGDLRHAAKLALWLRKSRGVWEPGQIVLCDRVFEQVAGWAGVVDRGRFISQHLRLAWALQRIRLEISNCWSAVYAARLNIDSSLSASAWEEIQANPVLEYKAVDRGGWTVNLKGVLLELDFLLARVAPGTPLHERLQLLKERTQNGQATARWAADLLEDFDSLESRTRRVRNSLVHGGPVSDDMASSVLTFVEWLTSEALYTAIKGLLSRNEVIDQFLDRREDHERSLDRLQRNEPPSEALFWDS